jgi:hypothetical protein
MLAIKDTPRTGLLVALLVGIGSSCAIYFGLREIIRQDEKLKTWTPVEAEVIDSDWGAEPNSDKVLGLPVGRLIDGVFGPSYGVAVSYRYTIDGKQYASGSEKDPPDNPWVPKPPREIQELEKQVQQLSRDERHYPDWRWSGRVSAVDSSVAYGRQGWAEASAAEFVKRKPCLAYYNPANPSEAYLLHVYDFVPYKLTIIAALFLLRVCL